MKRYYTVILIFICVRIFAQNNVGIGIPNPDASAILDLTSKSQGFLPPRMNSSLRTTIAAPATGLIVFDTDTGCLFFYTGMIWKNICTNFNYGDSVYFNPTGTVTVTNNGVPKTSVLGAWLTNGNKGTNPAVNFVGTVDSEDLVIRTHNIPVMTINGGHGLSWTDTTGNIGIGLSSPNWPPRNKLLVENGPPIPVYSYLFMNPLDVAFIASSNLSKDSNNMAICGMVINNNSSNNLGVVSLVSGNNSFNQAYGFLAFGNNSTNVGYNGDVGSNNNNSTNTSFYANTSDGGTNNVNTGLYEQVGIPSTNSTNFGINANIGNGSTGSTNTGAYIGIQGDAGPINTGVNISVTGATLDTSIGIICTVGGAQNYATPVVTGISYALSDSGDGGSINYGIVSDLSQGHPNGSALYYSIYGIQPGTGLTAASGTINNSGPYPNLYAGYFNGDVFASDIYYASDPSLKDNIGEYNGALEQLNRLPVKQYTFKHNLQINLPQGNRIGILSSDMKSVFPDLVKQTTNPGYGKNRQKTSFEAVNYDALIPVLVEAVKELNAKTDGGKSGSLLLAMIKDQQNQIAVLSKQVGDLKNALNDLRNTSPNVLTGGAHQQKK